MYICTTFSNHVETLLKYIPHPPLNGFLFKLYLQSKILVQFPFPLVKIHPSFFKDYLN